MLFSQCYEISREKGRRVVSEATVLERMLGKGLRKEVVCEQAPQ